MSRIRDLLIYKGYIGGGGGGGVTIKNQNKTITENGEYTADSGYTGLGKVTVDVAGGLIEVTTSEEMDNIISSATASDVGKVYIYTGETNEKYLSHSIYAIKES